MTTSVREQRLTGPFDSLREFVDALERRGRLVRIPEMDQDQFEATAFAYRLMERFGFEEAPAFLIERVKLDGRWYQGPIVANLYGGWDDEAVPWGVEPITDDQQAMYQAVVRTLMSRLDAAGEWPRIEPVAFEGGVAPVKEVVLTGDQVDIEAFPWFRNNPADGGRYINMGAVVMEHPDLGRNVGTYRCMVEGRNQVGVNPEPGQHGWRILQAWKRSGAESAPCAVVLGADPSVISVSGTKLAGFGEDEFAIAGGLRGRPLEMIRCETIDVMVPAHAEMIIEGEIPLDEMAPEGPYGEMYGYLGPRKEQNFFLRVTAVTHRAQPWFVNSFTGVTCDMPKGPQAAAEFRRYGKLIPNLVAINNPRGASGVVVVAIEKRLPGEGMVAGQYVAANPGSSKVVIVVDADINILDPLRVLHAVGARWQPGLASLIIPQTQLMMPDPSLARRMLSSKIVIDATRQLPEEGGPPVWPASTRTLLEEKAPTAFELVDSRWQEYFGS